MIIYGNHISWVKVWVLIGITKKLICAFLPSSSPSSMQLLWLKGMFAIFSCCFSNNVWHLFPWLRSLIFTFLLLTFRYSNKTASVAFMFQIGDNASYHRVCGSNIYLLSLFLFLPFFILLLPVKYYELLLE